MTLRQKQTKFAQMVAKLLVQAEIFGYEVTLGEAWRSPETCEMYAAQGKGISNSLHQYRLAIDINLFKGGVYLTQTEDYKRLGEWWESIGGSWGGRFNDGNHFSLEHNSIK